ncbi:MAG: hypothetical protein CSB47_01805 [Proteobacteria bacterium]|nr:MAG: hypothetical protein CSB47_01805 [Pseudomonadota bacterium]
MTFYVDAWLDCPEPYVRVINKRSRQVLADFSGETLCTAIEQGDICVSDFFEQDDVSKLELVKSLLLLRCGQDICQDVQTINQEVNHRSPQLDNHSNVFVLPVRNQFATGKHH